MSRLIYNLLFPIALLFFLPGYVLKMRRRGNYRRNFGQRFGIYGEEVRKRLAGKSVTWIHAVSVGEVALALKLATKLHELEPNSHCVLTTTTTTGFAFAEAHAAEWMEVMYNPLDFLPIMRRAFATISPRRVILVEAEVWPNLAAVARGRRIPLSLVNARLSPRSERRFRRFKPLVAPTFCCLDLVCVQEAGDIGRWAALGVPRTAIKEVGSIKYDPTEGDTDSASAYEALNLLGVDSTRPIFLGGSTHAGEEGILATVFLQLRREFRDLFLIIAPRHVERTRAIRAELENLGLRVALRSELEARTVEAPDCLVLDTTGELRNWYAVANVVFIGKSLTAKGGQNPVEPILAGKPVLFGPHMENFAALGSALLDQHAAIEVTGLESLEASVSELLQNPDAGQRLVENARRVLSPHRGATQRTAELVLKQQSSGNVGRERLPNNLRRDGALLILPPLS